MTRIARIALGTSVLAFALSGSCGDALQFDLTAKVSEFTVKGQPGLHHGGAPLAAAEVPPIELHFAAVKAGSVHMKTLRFFITDTSAGADDDDTFDFLTSLTVYLEPSSDESTLPGLPIAKWTGPAPADAAEIVMTVESQYDISQYILEGVEMRLETEGVVPYDDISVEGEAVFLVDPL